jgi:hypothetical protein
LVQNLKKLTPRDPADLVAQHLRKCHYQVWNLPGEIEAEIRPDYKPLAIRVDDKLQDPFLQICRTSDMRPHTSDHGSLMFTSMADLHWTLVGKPGARYSANELDDGLR